MKYLITLLFMAVTIVLYAQDRIGDRMKKDIEVAERIIAASFSNSYDFEGMGFSVEGSYLEGYGLLFTARISGSSSSVIWTAPPSATQNKLRNQALADLYRVAPKADYRGVYTIGAQDSTIFELPKFKKAVADYLADYGNLLPKLQAGEKVCLKLAGKKMGSIADLLSTSPVVVATIPGSDISLTAVVNQTDITDQQTGKLNREQLAAKITFSEEISDESAPDKDSELLYSIFQRLYSPDLSTTYRITGSRGYEKIEGLGRILRFEITHRKRSSFTVFGLSGTAGQSRWQSEYGYLLRERARTPRPADEDEEDEQEMEDETFETFLEGFKQNVVQYGGAVRNLSPEEILTFRLDIETCDECETVPEKVEITVKQSVLADYRKGILNMEQAVGQLKVVQD